MIHPFQKGVNFTAEWPDLYGMPSAARMLQSLPAFGINAVALAPYGLNPRNRPVVNYEGLNIWASDEHLANTANVARGLNFTVMVRPTLWVGGGDPAALSFSDPRSVRLWFKQYAGFVLHYAEVAQDIKADVFCLGSQLAGMTPHEAEWRALIATVRHRYHGPITYSARSGAEFDSIRFWDALDYLGLAAWSPLPDNLDLAPLARKAGAASQQYKRPVLLTEVGFPSLVNAHLDPRDDHPRAISLSEQARCYEAVFQAVDRQPWLAGMYWWKVGTNGKGGPDDGTYTPWSKPAMGVLKQWYTQK